MKTERTQIKRFALRALLRMDGIPMPQDALIDSIRLALPAATQSDIEVALKELEADHLAAANYDELTGTTWTLTDKGQHKAKQLG